MSMLPMPITQFRKRVEAHLESRSIYVTDDIRRLIRECWEDNWDVKHTILLVLKWSERKI